ncbi:MAG TPA: CUB domain-containing protein, partial [Chitinophagales bacterium]|nr:CUB domain-containing protein [Chitinophagales bacterium]
NTTYAVNASPSFPSTSYTSNASGVITITGLNTGNYTNIFLTLSGCSGPVFSGNIDDTCVNCGDQTSPCSSAGTFHFAIDGTATANTTGPFDLYSGQVLSILTNGDYSLPPPAGGVYPSGIAFAIFDCDPSGFDLTNPNTYSTSNPCYLDVDPDANHDYNTSETNCSGVSTSDPTWPSTVWVVPVTYDRYVTGIGGGVTYDANSDNCVNFACPFQINYLDVTQTIACGGTFTDANGSNNYCNNASDTWLICPSTPGDFVTLSFSSFATEATYDQLVIRNGSATGTILGTFSGNANPGTITSTAANGCLYASFTSDSGIVGAGWLANVSCAPAPSVCGTTFTDPGGASGNYNGGSNITYTFCPDVPGGVVTVTFTSFNVTDAFDDGCPDGKDHLEIYNGNSTASNLLGRYTSLPPSFPINSSDASGALTFEFTSDFFDEGNGWLAEINCNPTFSTPACPAFLTPADNMTNVPRDATFEWVTDIGSGSDSYALSIGTSPNPSLTSILNVPYFDNGLLLPNTTYYWTVDLSNSAGNQTGCLEQTF